MASSTNMADHSSSFDSSGNIRWNNRDFQKKEEFLEINCFSCHLQRDRIRIHLLSFSQVPISFAARLLVSGGIIIAGLENYKNSDSSSSFHR